MDSLVVGDQSASSVSSSTTGTLYLIPNRLGDDVALEVLPFSIKKIIELCDYYIVENEKAARRFIKKVSPSKSQQKLKIFEINKFTSDLELPSFLNPSLEGKPMAIISDAGCPCVADPGSAIVAMAHDKGIKVVPLVGPSSILLALMASGMSGQRFAFHGYLPIDKQEKKTRLKQLEKQSLQDSCSAQIFIETPYRNNQMLEDICAILTPDTRLCIAVDITLKTEYIKTATIKQWKHISIDLHKRPCIFILEKQ